MGFGDYLTCRPRYGANEYFANNLLLNNNLFQGNLHSLVLLFSHVENTFKFLTVNSPRRKWQSSIKEQDLFVQIFLWSKESGSSTPKSRLKRSLIEDANWTSQLPGKTHWSDRQLNKKILTKAKLYMVPKSWADSLTRLVRSWELSVPIHLDGEPYDSLKNNRLSIDSRITSAFI